MRNTFVQEALKRVSSPQILVNIISRRVRQLGQGFRPLVPVDPRWTFMDIALKEVGDGKLTYEMIEVEPTEATAATRKNKKKKAA